ncbi:MAG: cell division protein SepF [Actinobacteria bacterium]|nr:cell division protein SepF [Actinomycetota bacterium]
MAGMFRRAMVYLGLVEDDYDEMYDAGYEDPAVGQGLPPQGQYPQQAQQGWPQTYGRQFPPAEGEPSHAGVRPVQAGYRPDPSGRGAGELGGIGTITPRPTVVRSVTPLTSVRPHIVVARDFGDAQEIGRRFREAQAVIANLQAAERPLRRRLIDFCSGLAFGSGKMDKVADGVFLLTPSNVEVSEDEKRRLEERGFRG